MFRLVLSRDDCGRWTPPEKESHWLPILHPEPTGPKPRTHHDLISPAQGTKGEKGHFRLSTSALEAAGTQNPIPRNLHLPVERLVLGSVSWKVPIAQVGHCLLILNQSCAPMHPDLMLGSGIWGPASIPGLSCFSSSHICLVSANATTLSAPRSFTGWKYFNKMQHAIPSFCFVILPHIKFLKFSFSFPFLTTCQLEITISVACCQQMLKIYVAFSHYFALPHPYNL